MQLNCLVFSWQEKHITREDWSMNKPLTVRFNWKGDLKRIGGSFIGTSPEFEMALCTVCFLAREGDGRLDRIELDDYDVIVKAHRFGANLLSTCYPINKWNKSANERTPPPSGSGEHDLACEQALLFGRVKRVSREHASERRTLEAPSSRVLARLTSLAQIGELARGPTRSSYIGLASLPASPLGRSGGGAKSEAPLPSFLPHPCTPGRACSQAMDRQKSQ